MVLRCLGRFPPSCIPAFQVFQILVVILIVYDIHGISFVCIDSFLALVVGWSGNNHWWTGIRCSSREVFDRLIEVDGQSGSKRDPRQKGIWLLHASSIPLIFQEYEQVNERKALVRADFSTLSQGRSFPFFCGNAWHFRSFAPDSESVRWDKHGRTPVGCWRGLHFLVCFLVDQIPLNFKVLLGDSFAFVGRFVEKKAFHRVLDFVVCWGMLNKSKT